MGGGVRGQDGEERSFFLTETNHCYGRVIVFTQTPRIVYDIESIERIGVKRLRGNDLITLILLYLYDPSLKSVLVCFRVLSYKIFQTLYYRLIIGSFPRDDL